VFESNSVKETRLAFSAVYMLMLTEMNLIGGERGGEGVSFDDAS
jgi:hypothetical protein